MGMLLFMGGLYVGSFLLALTVIILLKPFRVFFKGVKEGYSQGDNRSSVEGETKAIATSLKVKRLTKSEIQSTSSYSRNKAMLFCLLGFIGVAGLHRFYVGRWGSGVVFLLTCGCFFLGTLIDLVYLYCESFEDQHGFCLECEARKRSNIKRAKWLYVYWNLRGRYYIDKTTVVRENKDGISILSCVYLTLVNDWGKKMMFNDQPECECILCIECIISFINYQINNGKLFVVGTRVQLLDKCGQLIKDEMAEMPWEQVYKNSIFECVYQKAREIENNIG